MHFGFFMQISIKSNDRVFVCGATGSGKTEFVKTALLHLYQRVVFQDHKIENNDLLSRGFVLANTPDQMLELMNANPVFKILYQPLSNDEQGYLDDFNRICEILYKFGNCTLIVDEASYYCTGHSIEHYHRELMTRGRSRGVGVVNLTQRPMWINNLIISEAQHLFVFVLNLDKDIQKLKGVLPKDMHAILYELPEFHYIYAGTNRIRQVCPPVTI